MHSSGQTLPCANPHVHSFEGLLSISMLIWYSTSCKRRSHSISRFARTCAHDLGSAHSRTSQSKHECWMKALLLPFPVTRFPRKLVVTRKLWALTVCFLKSELARLLSHLQELHALSFDLAVGSFKKYKMFKTMYSQLRSFASY